MVLEMSNVSLNLESMMSYKDEGVQGNVKGMISFLKNKIEAVYGEAKIIDSNKISITFNDGGNKEIETKNIVIATENKFHLQYQALKLAVIKLYLQLRHFHLMRCLISSL